MDSRAFARVEHAELNAGLIGIDAHFTAQRIEFPHQMAFGRSTHRRIAGHQGDIVHRERREQRITANAGGSQCRFHTGMASTYHDHIIFPGNKYVFCIHYPYPLFTNTELGKNLVNNIFTYGIARNLAQSFPG